ARGPAIVLGEGERPGRRRDRRRALADRHRRLNRVPERSRRRRPKEGLHPTSPSARRGGDLTPLRKEDGAMIRSLALLRSGPPPAGAAKKDVDGSTPRWVSNGEARRHAWSGGLMTIGRSVHLPLIAAAVLVAAGSTLAGTWTPLGPN